MPGRNVARIRFAPALRGAFVLAALTAALIGIASLAPSAGAVCSFEDGNSSTGGTREGSNPVRYAYANSPYLGVRFDSCGDVVRIYYGGYTGNTHYNIRWTNADPRLGPKQIEVGPGAARVYTLTASPYHGLRVSFNVQACKRSTSLFTSSTCTRWSPTVGVPVI